VVVVVEPVVPDVAPPVVVFPAVPVLVADAVVVPLVVVPLSLELLQACWSRSPLPKTTSR
jgi:hypothetical protein